MSVKNLNVQEELLVVLIVNLACALKKPVKFFVFNDESLCSLSYDGDWLTLTQMAENLTKLAKPKMEDLARNYSALQEEADNLRCLLAKYEECLNKN